MNEIIIIIIIILLLSIFIIALSFIGFLFHDEFTNLKNRFWEPKKNETYRNFNRVRFYDQHGNELGFASMFIPEGRDEYRINRVYFMDRKENEKPCTFEIDDDGRVEIRIKGKLEEREELFEENFRQGIRNFSQTFLVKEDKPNYQTGKYLGIETKDTRHYSIDNLEFDKKTETDTESGEISEEYNYYTYTVREK